MLTDHADIMSKLVSRLKTLERCVNEPNMVLSYSGAVRQQSWETPETAVEQQYSCFMCGGPRMKREYPQFVRTQPFVCGPTVLGNRGHLARHYQKIMFWLGTRMPIIHLIRRNIRSVRRNVLSIGAIDQSVGRKL